MSGNLNARKSGHLADAGVEKCWYTDSGTQDSEAGILKNIVISVQNGLLSEAIVGALWQRGYIRCQQVAPNRPQELLTACRTAGADVLLMEVNRFPAAALETRLECGDRIRQQLPGCRIVLLCDEVADPELAEQVVRARQTDRIDGFFYTSVTAGYLSAALDSM